MSPPSIPISVATPQWPSGPAAFATGWEWLGTATSVLDYLTSTVSALDDQAVAIQATINRIREATNAPAVALLTASDDGRALIFRVVSWSDGDDALPDPIEVGNPEVLAAVATVLAEWVTEATPDYRQVLGAPLGKDVRRPSGWLVVLKESGTDITWSFQLLEQLSWILTLALREGWWGGCKNRAR